MPNTRMGRPANASRHGGVLLPCLAFAVIAVFVIVGAVFFGLGAVQRIDEVTEQAALTGIAPAETGPALLVSAWSRGIDWRVQDLAILGGERTPEALVVLGGSGKGVRLSLSGQIVREFDLGENVYRAYTDPSGSLPGFLISTALTEWRWGAWGPIALREDLVAHDADGKEFWRFSLPPEEASRIDPYFGDFDGDGAVELVCPLKQATVLLDPAGKELRRLDISAPLEKFAVADINADGTDDMIWYSNAAEILVLDPLSGQRSKLAAPRNVDRLAVAAASRSAPATILTIDHDYNRGPRLRDVARITGIDGIQVSERELPHVITVLPHGGIVRADLDGDGEEAWVIGYGDGSLHFLSNDGSQAGVHYTGMRLASLKRLRRPGGDLLLTGTYRGITAWALGDGSNGFVE